MSGENKESDKSCPNAQFANYSEFLQVFDKLQSRHKECIKKLKHHRKIAGELNEENLNITDKIKAMHNSAPVSKLILKFFIDYQFGIEDITFLRLLEKKGPGISYDINDPNCNAAKLEEILIMSKCKVVPFVKNRKKKTFAYSRITLKDGDQIIANKQGEYRLRSAKNKTSVMNGLGKEMPPELAKMLANLPIDKMPESMITTIPKGATTLATSRDPKSVKKINEMLYIEDSLYHEMMEDVKNKALSLNELIKAWGSGSAGADKIIVIKKLWATYRQ
jgi:hypothetical protein